MIDLSSLNRALATLDEALAAHARVPEDKLIRDACIQRFEYSYELSHKMLRRYLEAA
ncbi:MAG TPA: nucleotidyltransferase substrate binding protein, partial [Acidocella sp.]|nr:nucleotidyltransferase substrate binding protein [Acidocella sp.]